MSYFSGRDGALYMQIGGTNLQKVAKAYSNLQLNTSQALNLDTTTLMKPIAR